MVVVQIALYLFLALAFSVRQWTKTVELMREDHGRKAPVYDMLLVSKLIRMYSEFMRSLHNFMGLVIMLWGRYIYNFMRSVIMLWGRSEDGHDFLRPLLGCGIALRTWGCHILCTSSRVGNRYGLSRSVSTLVMVSTSIVSCPGIIKHACLVALLHILGSEVWKFWNVGTFNQIASLTINARNHMIVTWQCDLCTPVVYSNSTVTWRHDSDDWCSCDPCSVW